MRVLIYYSCQPLILYSVMNIFSNFPHSHTITGTARILRAKWHRYFPVISKNRSIIGGYGRECGLGTGSFIFVDVHSVEMTSPIILNSIWFSIVMAFAMPPRLTKDRSYVEPLPRVYECKRKHDTSFF